MRQIVVATPAHNEEKQIAETIDSLRAQTLQPTRIVVISDNSTDRTIEIARSMGVEVFETVGNTHKKAGALNQWLDANLDLLDDPDEILVMDADSALEKSFIQNATAKLAEGYGACGGVFMGKPGGGFVGMLQRNEYARYARDVHRKDGKTLVLTGTATLFTVGCLRHVVRAREAGEIPSFVVQQRANEDLLEHVLTGAALPSRQQSFRSKGKVYDTEVLTEDNELTYALLHLGYKIIAPSECALKTDIMTSWKDLWNQRLRWKRGAIENNGQYGFTRYTAKYWGLQIWGMIGITFTALYLLTVTGSLLFGEVHIYPIWLAVTVIFMIERAVTVQYRGRQQMWLASILVVEMVYDLFLQAIHVKAYFDAFRNAKKEW